jgi:GPI mannosyltransferase 3
VQVTLGRARVPSGARTASALWFVLAVALALRLWAGFAHTYILYPDEVFQYLEQAHRLAFGAGVLPWEFVQGARSWLLPGAMAAVMRTVAVVTDDPVAGVQAIRLLAILASLSVPYVGYRMTERRFGREAALLTGLLCALWYQLVYFAPVVMTEEFAAYAGLLALNAGEPEQPRGPLGRGRLMWAGLWFGLAASLRYQYAPALALAALWQYRRQPRAMLPVVAVALAVLLLADGMLDWITWGAPFWSVWLNFTANAGGVAAVMGTDPVSFYVLYFVAAWGALTPVFGGLALLGALRAPALAIVAVAVIGLHSATGHKELRFVFLALAAAPILVGLGTARLRERFGARAVRPAVAVGGACVLAFGAAAVGFRQVTPPDAWTRDRSTLAAFEAAGRVPGVCGVGVQHLWVYRTGGYTFLGRNVPLYFESFERAQHVEGWPVRFPLEVRLNGQSVPQYPDRAFAEAGGHLNVLISPRGDELPGFALDRCFGSDSLDQLEICLYRRPGGCE